MLILATRLQQFLTRKALENFLKIIKIITLNMGTNTRKLIDSNYRILSHALKNNGIIKCVKFCQLQISLCSLTSESHIIINNINIVRLKWKKRYKRSTSQFAYSLIMFILCWVVYHVSEMQLFWIIFPKTHLRWKSSLL